MCPAGMHATIPPMSSVPPNTQSNSEPPSPPSIPTSDAPTWTCATTHWLLTHPSLMHTPPALFTHFAKHSPALSAVVLLSAVVTAATSAESSGATSPKPSDPSRHASLEPHRHIQEQLGELLSTAVFPCVGSCARELLLTPVHGDVPEASNLEVLRNFGSDAPPEIMVLALECLGALRACSVSARVYRPPPNFQNAAKKEEEKAGTAKGKKVTAKSAAKGKEPTPEPPKNPRLQMHALTVARVCAWSSDVWLEVDFLQVT